MRGIGATCGSSRAEGVRHLVIAGLVTVACGDGNGPRCHALLSPLRQALSGRVRLPSTRTQREEMVGWGVSCVGGDGRVSGATVAEQHRAEPHGLAELYERNAPGAVRLAYLITSDPDLAQDIAQEAFVRVAGRFRHLRMPEAFDAYLRRTVVNLCNSHFRHERVVRAALERQAAEASIPAIDEPDVELRDELRTALRQLPVRQRTAIVLHYYEDLSEEQLGEAMGCSASAARSLVSHGMQTLRTVIGSEER